MRDNTDPSPVFEPLILIADDDENMRELFERVIKLRLPSGRIAMAVNGAEAVERATNILPDVILMDVNMPVISGIDAALRLRAQAGTAAIPIIAVTGLPWNATLRAPFAAHVCKPCGIAQIIGPLLHVLRRTSGHVDAAPPASCLSPSLTPNAGGGRPARGGSGRPADTRSGGHRACR